MAAAAMMISQAMITRLCGVSKRFFFFSVFSILFSSLIPSFSAPADRKDGEFHLLYRKKGKDGSIFCPAFLFIFAFGENDAYLCGKRMRKKAGKKIQPTVERLLPVPLYLHFQGEANLLQSDRRRKCDEDHTSRKQCPLRQIKELNTG